jgi:periplasmic protein TonB
VWIFEFPIALDGTVEKIEYVSGPDVLKDAAIAAVKQRRFRPTLLNSQPVEVDASFLVAFAN